MRSIGDRKGCKGWVSHSLAFVATMLVAGLQFLFSPAWAGYELPGRTYYQSSPYPAVDAQQRILRELRSGHRPELRHQKLLDARRLARAPGVPERRLLRRRRAGRRGLQRLQRG